MVDVLFSHHHMLVRTILDRLWVTVEELTVNGIFQLWQEKGNLTQDMFKVPFTGF